MPYCHSEMEQPEQVLGMKDNSKVSLQITQGCNVNSKTTYVEARSTAFVSLLGYSLSLLMGSSSKLQLDIIYQKTLASIWHPILSSAFLRSCQQSDVFVIQTKDLDSKKWHLFTVTEGFFCSYIYLALGWDNESLRLTKYWKSIKIWGHYLC